jgi:hypothetical protein
MVGVIPGHSHKHSSAVFTVARDGTCRTDTQSREGSYTSRCCILTGTARRPAYSVDATRKLRAATRTAPTVLGIVVRVLTDAITAYSLAAWYGGAEVAASSAVGLVGLQVHARPIAAGLLGAATVPAAAAKLGVTVEIDADRLAQEDTSRRRIGGTRTDRLAAYALSPEGAEDAGAGAAFGAFGAFVAARAAVVIVKTRVDARPPQSV